MLRFISCGESHGPAVVSVLEGMPAGLELSIDEINAELARRQHGYGRGNRQKIENDTVEFIGGLRHGITSGAPLCMMIKNRDFDNWQYVMSPGAIDLKADAAAEQLEKKKIEKFRPGHADLAGTVKFHQRDIRDVLERASARETASRVAAGAVCAQFLQRFGVTATSHVTKIGSLALASATAEKLSLDQIDAMARESELFCIDPTLTEAMKELIKTAWQDGDSLGGVVEVLVDGLPVGLGSYTQWDRKLDAQLAQAIVSIQAMKAVEIGDGVENAGRPGSIVHDAIYPAEGSARLPFRRSTNHAGGIEGGMTNGERLVVRAYMKPIPTMRKGLDSISFPGYAADKAHYERSDVCAIAAASVVCKAMVCFVLANAFVDKFGGDSMADLETAVTNYASYCRTLRDSQERPVGHETEDVHADREPEGNEDAVGEF
ncbi:MAG: chorismate synthase [Terriglobales bacterium]